jgi:hypothetical protein
MSALVEFWKARVAILNAQFMALAARLALRHLRGDHQQQGYACGLWRSMSSLFLFANRLLSPSV